MKVYYLLLLFFISFTSLSANENAETIKGVVLERISHFITYSNTSDNTFIICIYDDKKLMETFSKVYANRTLNSMPISVHNVTSLDDPLLQDCDVLYSKKALGVDKLNLTTTLYVTEDLKALEEGFMIALYFEKQKIRFAINQKAIYESKLKVNYRLLKAASKVINPVKN